MDLFVIAIKVAMHSIKNYFNQWLQVKWELGNHLFLRMQLGDMCFRYHVLDCDTVQNEIAIKWRGKLSEFSLMFNQA